MHMCGVCVHNKRVMCIKMNKKYIGDMDERDFMHFYEFFCIKLLTKPENGSILHLSKKY